MCDLQMQLRSSQIVTFLVLELDLPSGVMWTAQGMSQTYIIALTMKDTTVHTIET